MQTGREPMAPDDAPVRVRMEDISKSFGAIKSLDRVNLTLRAGEVLGLLGDNGAGKSTLSKMLSGALVPDSGRIVLDGREVRFASPADARREDRALRNAPPPPLPIGPIRERGRSQRRWRTLTNARFGTYPGSAVEMARGQARACRAVANST